MRRVKFALVTIGSNIQYPDDVSKFGNTNIVDDNIYADYYGDDLSIVDALSEPRPKGDPVKLVGDYIDRYPLTAQEVIATESTNALKRIKFWLTTHQEISVEAGKEGQLAAQYMLNQAHITQEEYDAIVAY